MTAEQTRLKLYHTGDQVIQAPDIHYGRKNADFGWGFYLTPDRDFACRWAGNKAVLNEYELDTDGLSIHRFSRNEEWFRYIFGNRRAEDGLDADVIIGPIANDILFDTLGIISSGVFAPQKALRLLKVGPVYTQVAIKSEKAVRQLRWIKAAPVERIDEAAFRKEQEDYLASLAQTMEEL